MAHRLAVCFCLLAASAQAQPAGTARQGTGWVYTRLGNANDVTTPTRFGVLFGGGGTDVDAAFQWMCQKSGAGDFLVLRATGTPAYNPYIAGLCPALNSVSTLVIASRAAAEDPFILSTIRGAEAIFLSGGDQANYANFWRGTGVQRAISDAASRGVPVGGTSAGNAMLAQYAFSALHDTVTSRQALADPFSTRITIEDGFLALSPLLRDTITDDHFVTRDRMGRFVAFLARILHDRGVTDRPISGIAVADQTALLLEPDGIGTVVGEGDVYFLRARQPAEILTSGAPLTFRGLTVYRSPANSSFNLKRWSGSGGAIYSISAVSGILQSTQPGGSIY